MAYLRFFYKMFIALLIGVYATLLYVQKDNRFIAIVNNQLQQQFKNQLNVEMTGKITSINLFTLDVQIADAQLVPIDKNEGWKWRAKQFNISVSWLSFLYQRLFALDINFKDYEVFTTVDGGRLGIMNHIKKVIGGIQNSVVPLSLRSIIFQRARMQVTNQEYLKAVFHWNGQIGKAGHIYKSRFYLVDGEVKVAGIPIASKLSGITTIALEPGVQPHYRITNDLRMIINHLPKDKQVCFLEGTLDETGSACVLNNQDYSLHLDPLRTYVHGDQLMVKGRLTLPVAYFGQMFGGNFFAEKMKGICDISFVGDPVGKISGKVLINNPGYEHYGIEKVSLSFLTDGISARGALHIHKGKGLFAGAWGADFIEKTCYADLVNHTSWPIDSRGYWEVPAHKGRVSCVFDKNVKTQADYQVAVRNTKTETVIDSKGNCVVSPSGNLYAIGTSGSTKYTAHLQFFPNIKPLSFVCKDKDEKVLLRFSAKPPEYKEVQATISYDYIRNLLQDLFDYDLPGQGLFQVNGAYDQDQLKASLQSKDVTIRLPETYNFVSALNGDCTVSFNPLKIKLKNFTIQFHKGSFSCSEGNIQFSDYFEPFFLHFPLRFDKCFLNWRDDFFAVTSGSCVLQKRPNEPYSVDGFVTIEKGQLKENPLSQEGQREITQFMLPMSLFNQQDLKVNLNLMTRDPLYIKTPQLESRAVIDVKLSNTIRHPDLIGKLNLLGGTLNFPYKPLYITRSELQFLKDQPYDPVIDFVAQGTIKKYALTLAVSGTLQEPHIALSAIPFLTEEQIITLLFTGSIEESLNIMVPTLVMRNIEAFLFRSSTRKMTDSWFDPFKNIRIVPSFTDQTGRGGFRGALEIDVNDHLHARLQKNFSLSEDTRIEVEYLVSDDISVKAIKDERSDVGAEVEMRFKF